MRRISYMLILCLSILFVQAKDFRFALFTDLHITHSTPAVEDLQRAVDQVNATSGIDFVLVSGDITEEGDLASLQKAKSILDKLKVTYYITSGNHETKWSESGCTDFNKVFGSDRFRFEHNGYLFLGFNSGPVMRMADGHVAPQDISWLKQELTKAGTGKPVILVTHYPLQDGDVDNWYEVTDAVRPFNIKVVLGGHYHSNRQLFYDGIPGLLNRSTLRAKADAGGYSIYQVTNDSIVVSEQTIGGEPKRWAGVSLTNTYYTADNSTYKRPDFSVNKSYPQVKMGWSAATGKGIYSSPVVYNNSVYVGDDLGELSCYTLKEGKLKWTFKSNARIVGTPDAGNGVVVFGSADASIYGVDAKSGQLRWKMETPKAVLGAVTIQKGIAYVGGSSGSFYAIDVKTGRLQWEFTGVKGYIETKPLVYGDKVIFGAWDNNLYALEKATGRKLWSWDAGLTRMHFSPAAVWPVAAAGNVYVTAPDRVMSAIDLQSGQTVWRTKQSVVRETIGLSADSKQLYSKTMQDSLVCYATGPEVKQLWACNVGFGYEHAPSMPVEKEGVVFGSTRSGLLFAVEAKSGKLLWKYKVGNSLISTVVPLSKNRCLFTSSDGTVGLLEAGTK